MAPRITVVCPQCGKTGRVPNKMLGRRVRCPVCSGEVKVPRTPADELGRAGAPSRRRLLWAACAAGTGLLGVAGLFAIFRGGGGPAPAGPVGAVTVRPVLQAEGVGGPVAFSADGTRWRGAGRGGVIRCWEVGTWNELAPFATDGDPVAFSPDGEALAVRRGETVEIWEVASRRKLGTVAGHPHLSHRNYAVSPGGRFVALGADEVVLVEVATGRQVAALDAPRTACFALAFSPRGDQVVSAGRDGTARVWAVPSGSTAAVVDFSVASWTKENEVVPPLHMLFASAVSDDGTTIAVAGEGASGTPPFTRPFYRVDLHDLNRGAARIRVPCGDRMILGLALSPDGRLLAGGEGRPRVLLWDAIAGKELADVLAPQPFDQLRFSPGGRFLCGAGPDPLEGSEAVVWEVNPE